MNRHPNRNRQFFYSRHPAAGFTLTEMLVSIVTFAVLMTGLVSVLLISTNTLKLTNGMAAKTSMGMRLLSRVNGELVFAKKFQSRTSTAIEFTTSDRDGDAVDEIIRIEYLGLPENKIVKSTYYTLSSRKVVETLATEVTGFDFGFETHSEPIDAAIQERAGIEKLLFARDLALDDLSGALLDSPIVPDTSDLESLTGSPEMGPMATGSGRSLNDPGLGKISLLVVSDSVSLVTHELAIKNKMESLGVVVRLINQSASQTEFDTEQGLCDLIYVPYTVDAATLGSKVRDSELGIVTESVDFAEILGLGQASVELLKGPFVNCQHDATPLVAGEVAGALRIFDSQNQVSALEGEAESLSPHLRVVAGNEQHVTMAYLEKGDEEYLTDSSPEQSYGYTEEFASVGNSANWHHVGTQVSVTERFSASSISVLNTRSLASVLRFGIYSDDAGKPGVLLGETGYRAEGISFSGSWTTLELKESLLLEPGEYWIVASVFGSVKFHYEAGGMARVCFSEKSVFTGMMSSWQTGDSSFDSKLSMYITGNEAGDSPGRRVLVPWSGDGVDVNELSEHGNLVFSKVLQWAATEKNDADESNHEVRLGHSVCQYLIPTFEPSDTKWSISRVSIFLQPLQSDQTINLRVSLYLADTDNSLTGSPLATSDWIPVNQFAGEHFRWWTVPLTEVPELTITQGVCLVVETDSETAGIKLGVDRNTVEAHAKFSVSTDSGSTWNLSASSENMRFYVFGKTISNQ